ncbi:hypothetical protein DB88DRAFT_496838 [Papiliotrema laurentii]|uniref:Proteasome assembly chaperone 3 n=1 Tax=Papiliotrema laurentii TaxID=5418 RepID=A0AAD9FQ94_PAPLA|nr:hypothetical protein DB88DRAFT_496838 [Papiliotrema laurentii]
MASLLEEAYSPPLPSTSSLSPPPPILSYQLTQPILGVSTQLLIQTFDDRILVVLTQPGKIGSLVQASIPPVAQLPHPPPPSPSSGSTRRAHLPPPPDSISTTPLLGAPPRPTLHALYTNQIATLIWWTLQETSSARRPVVVGLALKHDRNASGGLGEDDEEEVGDEERDRFLAIMDMVVQWPGPSGNDI